MSKVILVTGGSKGIGANIVEGLARKGYTVILNYNNSEKEAKSNEKTEIGTDTNEDDNTENDENAISNYFYGNMYTFSIYNEAIDEEKILNNYIYNSKLIEQE